MMKENTSDLIRLPHDKIQQSQVVGSAVTPLRRSKRPRCEPSFLKDMHTKISWKKYSFHKRYNQSFLAGKNCTKGVSKKIPFGCKACSFSSHSIHEYLRHITDTHLDEILKVSRICNNDVSSVSPPGNCVLGDVTNGKACETTKINKDTNVNNQKDETDSDDPSNHTQNTVEILDPSVQEVTSEKAAAAINADISCKFQGNESKTSCGSSNSPPHSLIDGEQTLNTSLCDEKTSASYHYNKNKETDFFNNEHVDTTSSQTENQPLSIAVSSANESDTLMTFVSDEAFSKSSEADPLISSPKHPPLTVQSIPSTTLNKPTTKQSPIAPDSLTKSYETENSPKELQMEVSPQQVTVPTTSSNCGDSLVSLLSTTTTTSPNSNTLSDQGNSNILSELKCKSPNTIPTPETNACETFVPGESANSAEFDGKEKTILPTSHQTEPVHLDITNPLSKLEEFVGVGITRKALHTTLKPKSLKTAHSCTVKKCMPEMGLKEVETNKNEAMTCVQDNSTGTCGNFSPKNDFEQLSETKRSEMDLGLCVVSIASCSSIQANPTDTTTKHYEKVQQPPVVPYWLNNVPKGMVTMPDPHVLKQIDVNPSTWDILQNSFIHFPYPPLEEIDLLVQKTGLTHLQIKSWFVGARLKNGISWSPDEVIGTWAILAKSHKLNSFSQNTPRNPSSGVPVSEFTSPCSSSIQSNFSSTSAIANDVNVNIVSTAQVLPSTYEVTNEIQASMEPKGWVLCYCGGNHPVNEMQYNILANFPFKSYELYSHQISLIASTTGLSTCCIDSFYQGSSQPNQSFAPLPSAISGMQANGSLNSQSTSLQTNVSNPLLSGQTQTICSALKPVLENPQLLGNLDHGPSELLTNRRRKTSDQLKTLHSSFALCPFLSKEECHRMIGITGLEDSAIRSFFALQRSKLKKKMQKYDNYKNLLSIYDNVAAWNEEPLHNQRTHKIFLQLSSRFREERNENEK